VRRLILFRHAKAVGRVGAGGDLERPLEPRGRVDAAATGRWLASQGLSPDLALVSPSLRTRETWDCVAEDFPGARLQIVEELYNATPEDVDSAIGQWGREASVIIVVAHNPGLQELAMDLAHAGASRAEEVEAVAAGFPTSTVAVFDVSQEGPRLERLFNPRRPLETPADQAWDDEAGGPT